MNSIISQALNEGRTFLLEPEAKKLCSLYGLPVPKYKMVLNVDEALKAAEEIGFPLALKIVSSDILHKSDVGGVILNVTDREAVEKAYKRIMESVRRLNPKALIKGVMVEEMLPKGLEVAVGALLDAEFGPAIMFGLGGIFIELLRDFTFRVAPITLNEARKMMREVKGYKLLEGYRGSEPADVEAIAEIISKVSNLMVENGEIQQLDLNPIIVWRKGAKIADAKIILRP
ncbi:MAG: acetate--CoA ligase family protein [Candidatus Bathyarchaeia archaeon]